MKQPNGPDIDPVDLLDKGPKYGNPRKRSGNRRKWSACQNEGCESKDRVEYGFCYKCRRKKRKERRSKKA